jgi:hypothetical protein
MLPVARGCGRPDLHATLVWLRPPLLGCVSNQLAAAPFGWTRRRHTMLHAALRTCAPLARVRMWRLAGSAERGVAALLGCTAAASCSLRTAACAHTTRARLLVQSAMRFLPCSRSATAAQCSEHPKTCLSYARHASACSTCHDTAFACAMLNQPAASADRHPM